MIEGQGSLHFDDLRHKQRQERADGLGEGTFTNGLEVSLWSKISRGRQS